MSQWPLSSSTIVKRRSSIIVMTCKLKLHCYHWSLKPCTKFILSYRSEIAVLVVSTDSTSSFHIAFHIGTCTTISISNFIISIVLLSRHMTHRTLDIGTSTLHIVTWKSEFVTWILDIGHRHMARPPGPPYDWRITRLSTVNQCFSRALARNTFFFPFHFQHK